MQMRHGIRILKKTDAMQLAMVQRSAARLCCNNYSPEPGSVTSMLKCLGWPTLEAGRKLTRLSMFHRIYYGRIDFHRDLCLTPVTRTTRNCHPRYIHRPHSNCNQHAFSFFPWTIKLLSIDYQTMEAVTKNFCRYKR